MENKNEKGIEEEIETYEQMKRKSNVQLKKTLTLLFQTIRPLLQKGVGRTRYDALNPISPSAVNVGNLAFQKDGGFCDRIDIENSSEYDIKVCYFRETECYLENMNSRQRKLLCEELKNFSENLKEKLGKFSEREAELFEVASKICEKLK